jgi:hypothetical protein
MCAGRVLLDVPQTGKPVGFIEDRDRAVSTVPQRSNALVLAVVVPDVSVAHLLHRTGQRDGASRREHQMEVIGHERVRVNRHAVSSGGALEQREEPLVVDVLSKNLSAIDTAIDDMKAYARNVESRRSRHALSCEQDLFAARLLGKSNDSIFEWQNVRTAGRRAVAEPASQIGGIGIGLGSD